MTVDRREIPPTGILQAWVARLGLRHQGTLLTAVRGCDTAPKSDASKDLSRAIRGVILNTHCADPSKAKSFIDTPPMTELLARFNAFRKNCDHYPHHFVMHIVHAVEIIGYCHPGIGTRATWLSFYVSLCNGLHVEFETSEAMNKRLNADEVSFGESQDQVVKNPGYDFSYFREYHSGFSSGDGRD